MAEWLRLDSAILNKPRIERIRGVDVEVFVPPFDVPEAVRGSYDHAGGTFVIEFKYAFGDEPLKRVQDQNSVSVQIGKSSKRIYRIELDLKQLRVPTSGLTLQVGRMMESLPKTIDGLRDQPASREGNFDLAKEVIVTKKTDLLRSLVPA